MKVVVSSTGKELDSEIDPRFGRCAYFIVVDTDTMDYEAFDNGNLALGGGAGIQSAQFVASKGVEIAITGNCGPNAVRTLAAAGVKVIVGQSGTVRQVVEDFKAGRLDTTSEANVADHHGMRGGGMGGGMGRKNMPGQGMSKGGGMSGSKPSFSSPSGAGSQDQEVALLKEQIRELQAQVEGLQSRMRDSQKA